MINEIFNGDSASGIREKLNELITIVNHYSSSQFGGGDPAPGGGDEGTTIYVSDYASPFPETTSGSACSAVQMEASHTVYLSKDPMNMGGTAVPEANDYIYSDSGLTSVLSEGFYGYYASGPGENQYIEVGIGGQITQVSTCSDGGGGYEPPVGAESVTLWVSDPMVLNPESIEADACSQIDTGTSYLAYLSKDPMNMAGNSEPEVLDYIYSDDSQTMVLSQGYYGYYDSAGLTNQSIEVDSNGQIQSISDCV
jgi:hypothetical protein